MLSLAQVALGTGLGIWVGIANLFLEAGADAFYKALERRGYIRRLCPKFEVIQFASHKAENFFALSLAYIPNGLFIASQLGTYLARANLSFDIPSILLFSWVLFILHDAWFYAAHLFMHYFKTVYRNFHYTHHKYQGDLAVFGAGYAEAVDLFLIVASFHFCVFAYLASQPTWNPAALAFYFLVENAANLAGHSGYDLPPVVNFFATFGFLCTPWSSSSQSHYVHHLDPRYNRALYFTWWDKLAGTYRPTHHAIEEAKKQHEQGLQIGGGLRQVPAGPAEDDTEGAKLHGE